MAYLQKRSISYNPGDRVTVEGHGPGIVKSHLMIHPDYSEGAHYVSLEKHEFVRVELCRRNAIHEPNFELSEPHDAEKFGVVGIKCKIPIGR